MLNKPCPISDLGDLAMEDNHLLSNEEQSCVQKFVEIGNLRVRVVDCRHKTMRSILVHVYTRIGIPQTHSPHKRFLGENSNDVIRALLVS
jgi:hypothetical protein